MIDVGTKPAPIETVTPIKPSEAIRLGRLARPLRPRPGLMFGPQAACAIGAMAVGLGYGGDDADVAYLIVRDALQGTGILPISHIGCAYDAGGTDDEAIAFLESRGL